MSADITEVFWNAKPHLVRLGIKVGGGVLDPRAETLFRDVREGVAAAFSGRVALVRIATRSGSPDADLRLVRAGTEESGQDLETVRAVVDQAVGRAQAEADALASARRASADA